MRVNTTARRCAGWRSLACAAALLLGCRAVETPFPPGIEPLEENTASWPEGEQETLSITSGETDDYAWAHARGYVHAPAGDVWQALQEPAVVVDRRRVAEYSAEPGVEPAYDFSMRIDYVVREVITVEYELTWRHAVVAGDGAAPEVLGIRWQKTYGDAVLDLLEGSMVVRAEDDELTSLEIIEHLAAPTAGPGDIEGYFQDLHTDVVAFVSGHELPTYD